MAQTGITTAIGFALEQDWRTAPITVDSGALNKIGIVDNSPERFWTLEPGSGLPARPDIVAPDNELDGDIQVTRTILAGKTYNGSLSFKADGENLYDALLGLFGKDVQTQIQTAATGISANVFSHVFTPGVYFPSHTCEEIFGDHTIGRVSTGVVIQSLNLTFGRILMAAMNSIPYRQIPNQYPDGSGVLTDYQFDNTARVIPVQMGGNGTKTWKRTATPTYVDVQQEQGTIKYGNGPFVFAGMTYGLQAGNFAAAFMTVDDSPVSLDILEGMTLNMSRRVDATMTAGSGFDPGACTGSQWVAAGRIPILYKDTTMQLAALRHSKIALNFQIVGVHIGTGGTKNYVIDVFIPNMRISVPEGPNSVDGPMMTGGDWVARRDPSTGYVIQVTLQNTVDNRRLGQMYPLNQTLQSQAAAAQATATLTSASNVVPADVHIYTNGATVENKTVLSVNYTTNVVTYTANFTNTFAAVGTAITRVAPSGGGGWSNV